ncbi:peptide chain release factor N(5)-glutamine methyltransferase [Chitinimonas lacunae]|uniref:Release factor glutamine methyltransferase n=1 Tax=Chitinimonas lacunae TaxID=1963018 RepID=A0ABV8MTQ7_9NEIS
MSSSIADLLAECGLPRAEARLLLGAVASLGPTQMLGFPERLVEPAAAARFRELAARRLAGEPIAYLLGSREFYSLEFNVSPAVLIPRPDTELLVDLALERLPLDACRRVLDLGTGSGAIPVAIKKHRPDAQVSAVDLSPAALEVARGNAARHGVTIRFLQSDWFAALGDECFDLIVSNPPYIAAGDPHLEQGDLRFEPAGALSDGGDGLEHLRSIIAKAPAHLEPGGWLLCEHGYDQAEACRALLAAAGFGAVRSWCDLAGIERVSGGQRQ